nr:MAG TPA: hypothetical protein [Inoviridae sp.]
MRAASARALFFYVTHFPRQRAGAAALSVLRFLVLCDDLLDLLRLLRRRGLAAEALGEQPTQQPGDHPDHETGHQHEDEQADQDNGRRNEKLYHIYTSLLKSFGPAVDI